MSKEGGAVEGIPSVKKDTGVIGGEIGVKRSVGDMGVQSGARGGFDEVKDIVRSTVGEEGG